jgi:hypothetical protein
VQLRKKKKEEQIQSRRRAFSKVSPKKQNFKNLIQKSREMLPDVYDTNLHFNERIERALERVLNY